MFFAHQALIHKGISAIIFRNDTEYRNVYILKPTGSWKSMRSISEGEKGIESTASRFQDMDSQTQGNCSTMPSRTSDEKDDELSYDVEEKNDEVGERNDEVKLERSLGLLDGVMVNVGVIIGVGIFVSPKGVLAGVSSVGATLVVWGVSGVISLFGAMCYAELGTTISSSGGTYTYLLKTFGDFIGFSFFWSTTVMVVPAANAITALTFSYYCLRPFFPDPDCPPPDVAIEIVAVLCVLLIMFINCWSVRLASFFQDATSVFKLLALAMIIMSGLVMLGMGKTENFSNSFESTNIKGLGTALYACLYSYAGWDCLNIIVEELKNPTRNLPLAIFISISTVTLVYTLTNVAYFTILSPSDLLSSNAVGFTFAAEIFGNFAWTIPLAVALSSFGSLNGSLLAYSRQMFVGAREGHFPALIAMINVRHKTPIPAVLLMAIVTFLFCFVDNIFLLLNFFSFVKWLYCGLAVGGLLYLRIKDPDRPRPYKVNILVAVAFLLTCVFLVIAGVLEAPIDAAIGIAFVVSSIPVYLLTVRPKTLPIWIKDAESNISLFCQKILFVAEETKEE